MRGSCEVLDYSKWGELTIVVLKKSVTYILKTKGRFFSLFMVVTLEKGRVWARAGPVAFLV